MSFREKKQIRTLRNEQPPPSKNHQRIPLEKYAIKRRKYLVIHMSKY